MDTSDHKLFLIEFLVDSVDVLSIRAIAEENVQLKTVVSIQILDLPVINIQSDDSTDMCLCLTGDKQSFRKGKSCLFALPSNVLEKPLHTFPITVSVNKMMPFDMLPDIYLLGKQVIQIKDLVNATLAELEQKVENPSKAMKGAFDIQTDTGKKVGQITMFIRVSCLGKKLVTQFQIPKDGKLYLFKGTDESPIFQCKKICLDPDIPKCICKNNKPVHKGEGEQTQKSCCPKAKSKARFKKKVFRDETTELNLKPCCPALKENKVIKDSSVCPPNSKASLSTAPQSRCKENMRKCGCPLENGNLNMI